MLFKSTGHLWENILKGNALHRAFSVFLFNSKHELLLQVCGQFFQTMFMESDGSSPDCDEAFLVLRILVFHF